MNAPVRPQPHPGVMAIEAYVPGKSSAPGVARVFKLSSNETPLGPSSDSASVAMSGEARVPWYQFQWAVQEVDGALRQNAQVPTVVWVGGNPYSPASYLVALAQVAGGLLEGNQPPQQVTLAPAQLDAAKYVAKNTPQVWSWPIFRPGFNGQHLLDLARLQAWTLKPALLRTAPGRMASGAMPRK